MSKRLLYLASWMIFFWGVFDGILTYLVPILITERGYSNTQMGIIVGFSSITGACLDFLLSRILRKVSYIKTFLLILLISATFPLVLWYSSNIFLYLLSMAIWGLYFDLYTFASYDFVGHYSGNEAEHSGSFGVIELFRSMAGLIAPLIAAYLIVGKLTFFNLGMALIFLVVAAVFYIFIYLLAPEHKKHAESTPKIKFSMWSQINLWKGVARVLFPVLIFNTILYIFDAVFWTIGPIFSENFPSFPLFSGVFMILYNLPTVFTAWKMESITRRFGKKRTAMVSFLLANLLLIPVGYTTNTTIILLLIFCSAIFVSIAWPAFEGAIADYVSETNTYQPIIEGLTDVTCNFGYIIGPIMSGFLSDQIGIAHSFATLGIFNIVIVGILLLVTPKHINVVIHKTDNGIN